MLGFGSRQAVHYVFSRKLSLRKNPLRESLIIKTKGKRNMTGVRRYVSHQPTRLHMCDSICCASIRYFHVAVNGVYCGSVESVHNAAARSP